MDNEVLIQQLNKLIEPKVTSLGYEFYHLELVKEEGEDYLRVYIDSENGISLQDCERVSRPISAMLDEDDPIPFGYYLEVSSPGVYRTLFNDYHLNKSMGAYVLIQLNSLLNGKREVQGELKSFDEEQVIIKDGVMDISIPKEKIKNISLTDKEEGGNK
ncbi:MAG: ribosome maturation factor RimP [Clostridiaceae bacterium]|nr:ribosome maturation factor RimP [Clostridiaceae bacterium]